MIALLLYLGELFTLIIFSDKNKEVVSTNGVEKTKPCFLSIVFRELWFKFSPNLCVWSYQCFLGNVSNLSDFSKWEIKNKIRGILLISSLLKTNTS